MAYFFSDIIRSHIVAFGFIFQDILVKKFNESGVLIKELLVPISYSNKDKSIQMFTVRGDDPSNYGDNMEMTLPRFGFEIVDFNYNPEQKLNRMNKYIDYKENILINLYANNSISSMGTETINTHTKRNSYSVYTPTPYKMRVNLYLMTNKENDYMQIVEQILPMFTPDIKLNMKYNIGENINLFFDESITLDHVSKEILNDQNFDLITKIIHTFSFSMDIKFFNSEVMDTDYLIKHVKFTMSTNINEETETVEFAAAPFANNIVVDINRWYNQFYNYMYFDMETIESSDILEKYY